MLLNSMATRHSTSARLSGGFTLIELLLYIAVSSAILLASSVFLATMLGARVKSQSISEVEAQGAQAMETILQTVRNASSVVSPATSTTAASLSLATYSGATNPTVFDVSGGALRITEGVGSPVALTSPLVSVASFSAANVSRSGTPGTLRISFTLTYVHQSGRNEYAVTRTFIGSASLRHP